MKFNIYFFLFVTFSFSSCTNYRFSTPLCGPKSSDQRPYVSFPEGAEGCYDFSSFSRSFGSLDKSLFTSTSDTPQYVWIGKDGPQTQVSAAPKFIQQLKEHVTDDQSFPMCDSPFKVANPNARVIMNEVDGMIDISEYVFDRSGIKIGFYEVSTDRLKKSGLSYLVVPHWTGKSSSSSTTYPKDEIVYETIDFVLINNSRVSPEVLFERAGITKNSFAAEAPRVADSFCKTRGMAKMNFN